MSATAKALGLGTSITYEGKTYDIPPLDTVSIGKMERWVEKQQWDAHRRSQEHLSPAEYAANAAALRAEIGSHEYAYPRPGFLRALMSLPGLKYRLFVCLSPVYPEVDEEFVDKMVDAKFDEIVEAILEGEPETDPMTAAA